MGEKKQIVHLIHFSSRPGGIEVLLPVLINAMPEWEFKGYVIRKPVLMEPNIYESINIPVQYGSRWNPLALGRIFAYAHKNREHIFHVFNIGPLFLFVLRLAGAKKLIYSIHGTIYWKTFRQKIFLKLLWRMSLNRNNKITSNSEYSKRVFKNEISLEHEIQVLYNPVNGQRFTPSKNIERSDQLRIVYVGRLSNGKNLEKWIDLAFKLHTTFPETQFEIYGMGPLLESLQHKIEILKAGSFVFLKGFRPDIENIYRNADLLLFLSEYESFGNVAVESILCGTPVIVSDIPSMREIFKDFPEFIVTLDKNLHQEVHNKLLDINKLKEKVLVAREDFVRRFSIEVHVDILNKIYKSIDA